MTVFKIFLLGTVSGAPWLGKLMKHERCRKSTTVNYAQIRSCVVRLKAEYDIVSDDKGKKTNDWYIHDADSQSRKQTKVWTDIERGA